MGRDVHNSVAFASAQHHRRGPSRHTARSGIGGFAIDRYEFFLPSPGLITAFLIMARAFPPQVPASFSSRIIPV